MSEAGAPRTALTIDEMLTTLAAAFPDWEVWTHEGWDGRQYATQWCARLRVDCAVLRHAWEARHLAEYLAEHERPGSVWG